MTRHSESDILGADCVCVCTKGEEIHSVSPLINSKEYRVKVSRNRSTVTPRQENTEVSVYLLFWGNSGFNNNSPYKVSVYTIFYS